MAKENMTTCAACGQAIAKSSKTCPHCGAKNKKPWFKKWWVWLLAVLIVAAIGSASSGSSPKQAAVSGAVSSPAPAGAREAAGSNANAQMPDLELVDNFKAGGTWKFKAMALESADAIASYELAEITGF